MAKRFRTPEQQRYRKDKMENLRLLRNQGPEGRKVARDVAETLFKSPEYAESKGRPRDEVFHEIKNHVTGGESCDTFNSDIKILFRALRDGEIKLTESQKEIVKEVILFCFKCGSYRNSAVVFLQQNFDIFTQEEKEELILSAIKYSHLKIRIKGLHYDPDGDCAFKEINELKSPQTYSMYDKHDMAHDGADYFFTSKDDIKYLVENVLANSTNDGFIFHMLPYLAREGDYYNIPENCKMLYSNPEKFKSLIISENYMLKEMGEAWFDFRLRTYDIFPFFKNQGIIITWEIADLLVDWLHCGGFDSKRKKEIKELSGKIIDEKSVRISLNSIMGNLRKEDLKKFEEYFSSEYIWNLLDDKYKMPEFVNKHVEELEPILDVNGIEALLKNFGTINGGKELSDSEKFDRRVFDRLYHDLEKDFPDIDEQFVQQFVWPYIDLTTLNSNDFGDSRHGLYDFIKKQGLLGTDYVDKILEGHGYPGTHSVYYMLKAKGDVSKDFLQKVLDNTEGYVMGGVLSADEAVAFMQDVYATEDVNMIKKLFSQIGYFKNYCSEEDINILIRKMIKVMSSQEDFALFMKEMDEYAYKPKFSLFLKIKYLLTNSLDVCKIRANYTKVPSDVYSSLVASGIINISKIDRWQLPSVGSSVFLDAEELERLGEFYGVMLDEKKQADEKKVKEKEEIFERLRKEREEEDRIYNEALENREKGEVVFDSYENDPSFGSQKYVLSIDSKNGILKFISAPIKECCYHSMLHNGYVEEGYCLGGGFIDKDDENKIIRLWGYSISYGDVSGKNREAMKKMLEKKFPDYKIIL